MVSLGDSWILFLVTAKVGMLFAYFQRRLRSAVIVALGWDLGMVATSGHSNYGESPASPALPNNSNALICV